MVRLWGRVSNDRVRIECVEVHRAVGFLMCHSTLTNAMTREWLEGVRQRKGVDETGIPADEYVELSLLEPHKRFQNSMTILQKRVGGEGGARFSEPLYSEYA